MFTAAEAIAELDDALALAGQDIVIRRPAGTSPSVTFKDVTVCAMVRSYSASELVNGMAQTDSKVIIGPTQIATAGWPVGESASATVENPSMPRRNDKAVIAGRTRNIEAVDPVYMGGTLVRIVMRVLG